MSEENNKPPVSATPTQRPQTPTASPAPVKPSSAQAKNIAECTRILENSNVTYQMIDNVAEYPGSESVRILGNNLNNHTRQIAASCTGILDPDTIKIADALSEGNAGQAIVHLRRATKGTGPEGL
jgi:hypothetical protein